MGSPRKLQAGIPHWKQCLKIKSSTLAHFIKACVLSPVSFILSMSSKMSSDLSSCSAVKASEVS